MKGRKFYATVVAIALGLVGAVALAQGGPGGGHRGEFGFGGFNRHMAQALNLTDQQQTQIKSILQAEKPAMQPLMLQLKASRQQMDAATQNGQFDEAKVRSIAEQQAQTMVNLTVEREKVKSEIWQVLTPDQRAKAEQMKQQFGERHRGPAGAQGQQAPPPPQP